MRDSNIGCECFTYYLAKALKGEIPDDHNYCRKDAFKREDLIPPELYDHSYAKISHEEPFTLDQQYTDDIGWMAVAKYRTDFIKDDVPSKLKARNLMADESKTEELTISQNRGKVANMWDLITTQKKTTPGEKD